MSTGGFEQAEWSPCSLIELCDLLDFMTFLPCPEVVPESDIPCTLRSHRNEIPKQAGVDGYSSSSPVFYLNCAGGAAFHNLSHVRQTIQDAGFANCRVDDVSRELGLLSVQGSVNGKLL